jgi:hypothetical protein
MYFDGSGCERKNAVAAQLPWSFVNNLWKIVILLVLGTQELNHLLVLNQF